MLDAKTAEVYPASTIAVSFAFSDGFLKAVDPHLKSIYKLNGKRHECRF